MADLDFKYKIIIAIIVIIILGGVLTYLIGKLIPIIILAIVGYLGYIYYKRRQN